MSDVLVSSFTPYIIHTFPSLLVEENGPRRDSVRGLGKRRGGIVFELLACLSECGSKREGYRERRWPLGEIYHSYSFLRHPFSLTRLVTHFSAGHTGAHSTHGHRCTEPEI